MDRDIKVGMIEQVRCEACASTNQARLFSVSDPYVPEAPPFSLAVCRDCGLGWVNPKPDPSELGRYYTEAYYASRVATRENDPIHRSNEAQRRLKRIERIGAPGKRLLDVGCGYGDFIAAAKLAGWEVLGIEFSENVSGVAREQKGLPVITGSIDEFDLPPEHFDIVTMWMVLEHMLSPSSTVSRIRDSLKGNGVLLIQVPNFGCLQSRVFGPNWYGLDVPRHLYQFTAKSLGHMLGACGFRLLQARLMPTGHDVHSLTGSLRLRFGSTELLPGNEPKERRGSAVLRLGRGVLRRAIPIAARVMGTIGGGASMEVIAIKGR